MSCKRHATLCQIVFVFGCGSLFLLLLIGNRRRVRLNACSSNDGLVRCYGLLDVRTQYQPNWMQWSLRLEVNLGNYDERPLDPSTSAIGITVLGFTERIKL